MFLRKYSDILLSASRRLTSAAFSSANRLSGSAYKAQTLPTSCSHNPLSILRVPN